MNRGGQFFLITALIFISIVSGVTGIANYVNIGKNQNQFYDLSKEVGFETKKILDWGVFNKEDIDSLTDDFLFKYSDYIGENEVIFIYGDKNGYKALTFKENNIGSVGLNTGSNKGIQISRRTGKKADDVILDSNKVSVVIDGTNYDFDLRDGQNFFFVIIKDVKNERFVARG